VHRSLCDGGKNTGTAAQACNKELLEGCLQEGCLQKHCLQEGCLQKGCLQKGCLQEGCLQEGCLQEGCLQEGCLQEGWLVESAISVGSYYHYKHGSYVILAASNSHTKPFNTIVTNLKMCINR
jgi:hypothetical protein